MSKITDTIGVLLLIVFIVWGGYWGAATAYRASKAHIEESNKEYDKWFFEEVNIAIRSEQDNSLIYTGGVTQFSRHTFTNGARFVDSNGNKQSIKGNVVLTNPTGG